MDKAAIASLQTLVQSAKEKEDAEHTNYTYTNYTYIKEDDLYVCNDCGAVAPEVFGIQHFSTCIEGNSESWMKFYEEAYLNERIEELERKILEARAAKAATNAFKRLEPLGSGKDLPGIGDSLKSLRKEIKREMGEAENYERHRQVCECMDALKLVRKLEKFFEKVCSCGWYSNFYF